MNKERFLVIGGAGLARMAHELSAHTATADIYIGEPPIQIKLKPFEPIIPDFDIKIERQQKRRDWEQRNRKQRRR